MSDSWYYVDHTGQIGPVALEQLKETLPRLSEPENVLVWRAGFSDWMKACDVPELAADTSRTAQPPTDQMPTWRVKWWWYPVPFLSIAIGSRAGREVMMWSAAQRRKARQEQAAGTRR